MSQKNRLYYGDNLDILRNRDYFPDECVDLIYLDPPFNSARDYNILFSDERGQRSEAQIVAFKDTWVWGDEAARTYARIVLESPPAVSNLVGALRAIVGATSPMMAYLVMMTARLVELHRVLKPTGSLFLHCDPTAVHYLKVVLDTIFGPRHFRNEIVWKRTSVHNDARLKLGDVADMILYYSKTDSFTLNIPYIAHDEAYTARFYRHVDADGRRYALDNLSSPNRRPNLTYVYKGYQPPEKGWRYSEKKMAELDAQGRLVFPKSLEGRVRQKRYLDEMPGVPVGNVWTDIGPLQAQSRERLGYPTQKPQALLERIIAMSSNPGDVVLDPFCGCGTAIAAAQSLDRRWLGIDVTHLSVSLMTYRLRDAFNLHKGVDYDVIGEPRDVGGARSLALENRYQFQWWALSLIEAKPVGSSSGARTGKKGADAGIDGEINFIDDPTGKVKRVIVQVKSGTVGVKDIRDLVGTIDRENAQIGIFITLEEPTAPMRQEAASAGVYTPESQLTAAVKTYPRVQILTIQSLFDGKEPDMPRYSYSQFRRAAANPDKSAGNIQHGLGGEFDSL